MTTQHFDITTSNRTVRLDNQGKGTVSFTISNKTGDPIEAYIDVVPLDDTQKEWITVQGEGEGRPTRQFGRDESQQITVEIESSPEATSDKQAFRILVAAVNNQNSVFTEGPVVVLEVTPRAATPPPPEPKKFPWWIIIVVVVVFLFMGVGITMLALLKNKTSDVTVPEFSQLLLTQAEQLAKEHSLDLEVIEEKITGEQSEGTVLSQQPSPSVIVAEGTTIKVVVEAVSVEVPNLVRESHEKYYKTLISAVRLLNNKEFKTVKIAAEGCPTAYSSLLLSKDAFTSSGEVNLSDLIPSGKTLPQLSINIINLRVIGQAPAAGTAVSLDTPITLITDCKKNF